MYHIPGPTYLHGVAFLFRLATIKMVLDDTSDLPLAAVGNFFHEVLFVRSGAIVWQIVRFAVWFDSETFLRST